MKNDFLTPFSNQQKKEAFVWYKHLSLDQRLALKDFSKSICGMKWEDFNILFTPRERLCIIHEKLKLEGFAV